MCEYCDDDENWYDVEDRLDEASTASLQEELRSRGELNTLDEAIECLQRLIDNKLLYGSFKAKELIKKLYKENIEV